MKRARTLALALWHAALYLFAGKPVIAPKAVRVHRLHLCLDCQYHDSGVCDLCECFIGAKTKLSSESCPDQPPRWKAL